MKIAVLGCGPAGLMAAEAARQLGLRPEILSRRTRSKMFGAMFLHEPIPTVNNPEPDFYVNVIKVGEREGYADNVYGNPNHEVSWDKFNEGDVPGWDLRQTYNVLWAKWNEYIIDHPNIGAETVSHLGVVYDVVISSLPLPSICSFPHIHRFKSQDIAIVHGPYTGWLPNDYCLMYYNGYTSDLTYGMIGPPWYRYSLIRGYQAWEYRQGVLPKNHLIYERVDVGVKPLSNDCNCHERVIRVGRFGKWEKNVLTHHAYQETRDALLALL